MAVRRAVPAVALLLLAGETHAYIGRAARFLRRRIARPSPALGADQGSAPLPTPAPVLQTDADLAARPLGVDTTAGAETWHLQDAQNGQLRRVRGIEVRPLEGPSAPLGHFWQLYDNAWEVVRAQSGFLLGDKQARVRYPQNVFLSSSTLLQCRAVSACPGVGDGAFDVVGFMDVDTRPFLEAVGHDCFLPTNKTSKAPKPRKMPRKDAPSNSMLYWKKGDARKAAGLPVTKLRAR